MELIKETFCITNLEAMALGIPVVSFGIGGVSDYLRHEFNGFIAPQPTPLSLAETVQSAFAHPDFATIKQNARNTALTFSIENMISKYLSLYASLV